MLALDIQNLTKVYKNEHTALDQVNIEVKSGDFFGLIGPNGAGKTTLIGILSSIVNKTSGSAKIFGYDLSTHLQAAKMCIGVVPQEFNFNIFEKVEEILINQAGYYGISRSQAYKPSHDALKTLGLWDKRRQPAGHLSGGMKRRLLIARALVHQPRMLILDEPTAGVDIELRRSMWSFLRELNAKGVTIILTTHYLEEAENLCRNIAIIDHGKLVENTSTRKLIHKLRIETFVFELAEPISAQKAQSLADMGPYTTRLIEPTTLEIDLDRKMKLNSVFEQFNHKNIVVAGMRNKANRLEELFMKLLSKDQPIHKQVQATLAN